jgi:hypothetical protein
MYRIHGADGNAYEAPSLAVLQVWVLEGRVIPATIVEDLLSGTEGPASGIPGLEFHQGTNDFAQPNQAVPQYKPSEVTIYLPLIKAVISTLCCSYIGVFAVIYAAKIPEIIAAGDTAKARQYARIANILSNISFIVGVLFQILFLKYAKQMGLPF